MNSPVLIAVVSFAFSASADTPKVTLASLVPSPAKVKVHEPKSSFEVTKTDDIKALLAGLGADKPVLATTPRCMTIQTLEFDDAKGNVLGTVGFCDGAKGTGGYDQDVVFLDAKKTATHGLAKADAAAVENILATVRK